MAEPTLGEERQSRTSGPTRRIHMEIPGSYLKFKEEQPELVAAYETLGRLCTESGPLDARTAALVKLAVSMGAGLEGAAHSHIRKAIEAGWTREELLHAAVLCTPTIGFPSMMRARKWVLDVAGEGGSA
jgi:4-carboxymuconolactone decarboxylase